MVSFTGSRRNVVNAGMRMMPPPVPSSPATNPEPRPMVASRRIDVVAVSTATIGTAAAPTDCSRRRALVTELRVQQRVAAPQHQQRGEDHEELARNEVGGPGAEQRCSHPRDAAPQRDPPPDEPGVVVADRSGDGGGDDGGDGRADGDERWRSERPDSRGGDHRATHARQCGEDAREESHGQARDDHPPAAHPISVSLPVPYIQC